MGLKGNWKNENLGFHSAPEGRRQGGILFTLRLLRKGVPKLARLRDDTQTLS